MNSYDLGCSYGGGPDSASVLLDAGLAAVSNDLSVWRKGKRKINIEMKILNEKSLCFIFGVK